MKIEWVKLKGFRNFKDCKIQFNDKTLIIGANDVGKTNLLYAIRLLLDRTLSQVDIEPQETDFHVALDGAQASKLEIVLKLVDITEDAILSKLKGYVNDDEETFLKYTADLDQLSYRVFIGFTDTDFEEIESRFYLKHIHFRYIESTRDLGKYIQTEKKHLLKIAKENREDVSVSDDKQQEETIQTELSEVNTKISELSYVSEATNAVNDELKKLSHHNDNYQVNLEAKSVNFSTFLSNLTLGASTSARKVGLGGDGRNNQILVALWKAKSQREHDLESEAVIYCIEEPEAHLHPHQQRKLSDYLINELEGQVFVSSHSPQITASFSPDSIVRIFGKSGESVSASNGCSPCVEEAWEGMGYRISILPAEAFFSDGVFLVEGHSEILFYSELANQLEIDLDYHNISILSVDGIAFKVYVKILDALEIPWVLRTDNDVSKVKNSDPVKWRFAGLNRALELAGEDEIYKNVRSEKAPDGLKELSSEEEMLNSKGIYVSKKDLESDLGNELGAELMECFGKTNISLAVKSLQSKKAIKMRTFLKKKKTSLARLAGSEIAKPLIKIQELTRERSSEGDFEL